MRKSIAALFALATLALSAAPALAGGGGGSSGGGGGGMSYETAGPVTFWVAGGFGWAGGGGCGGIYAYNSATGQLLTGSGGSIC